MLTVLVASSLAFAPPTALRSPVASRVRASSEPCMLSRSDGGKVLGALLAGMIVFAPLDEAQAARSGGRVGGRAPVSRSAPAPVSRTNVYVAPTPVYGGGFGYGYGGGVFGGGISTGTYLGLSLVDTLIREQQRQQYLQQQLRTQQELGRDQAMIQQLQSELAAQNAKVEGLKAQQQSAPAAPQGDSGVALLQQQLLQQQKEIELLKASK